MPAARDETTHRTETGHVGAAGASANNGVPRLESCATASPRAATGGPVRGEAGNRYFRDAALDRHYLCDHGG
jgi:hypothetical protein